jgi:hypothetical protein
MANRVEKYLRFDLVGPSRTGKTKIWQLTDLKYGDACGTVKWYGGFRRYVFEPNDSSFWGSDALGMIAAFLRKQNGQHRHANGDASA